jgi:hypothetical protein
MAYPSVTYTFTNGTTASATEVNQNFTDLINGLSDGTKDLSISALTVAGTASLNGAVNIGNATSDDIAVNGYITTALIPKADDSYDLGTAALAWQDAYFDGAVYTDTISELTAANGVTIDETKLKDGGVILKTGAEISDAGGKYVKIKGGDGSGAVAAGYIGEVRETTTTNWSAALGAASGTSSLNNTLNNAAGSAVSLDSLPAGTWAITLSVSFWNDTSAIANLLHIGIGISTDSNATSWSDFVETGSSGWNSLYISSRDLDGSGNRLIGGTVTIIRTISSATTYYAKALRVYSGAGNGPKVRATLRAVRMA